MYRIKSGIFAAGKGERLKKAFLNTPKPLIKIGEKSLIEITLDNLLSLNPVETTILLNNENYPMVVDKIASKYKCNFIALNSKTSFESFYTLASFLDDDRSYIILSTTDVITEPSLIKKSFQFHISSSSVITLGVSNIPPDEKPLLVELDKDMRVKSIGKTGMYATNGIYILCPGISKLFSVKNYKALREFLSQIDFDKIVVKGFYFDKSFDVDDETDLNNAELFIKNLNLNI